MKKIVTLLGLFICIGVTLQGQINPTTHIKPAADSNMILITKEPNYRVYYRDAKSYLTDSAGMFKIPTDSVTFNNNENDPDTAELQFNSDKGFLIYGGITAYPIEVGQSLVWLVKNQTGSSISKGTVVYANGTVGASGRITIAPFIADGTINNNFLLGITAETIANGEDGYVVAQGKIRNISTTAYSAGDVLYASATSAGALQNTAPGNGFQKLPIAFVVHSASNGTIAVRIKTGETIGELHDVDTTGLSDNDVLAYDAATGLWKAEAVSGGGGLTVAGDSLSVQINDGNGDLTASSNFLYYPSIESLFAGDAVSSTYGYLFTGENISIFKTAADELTFTVGAQSMFVLSETDITDDIDLGLNVRLDMRNANPIVDDNGSTGVTGYVLKRAASGGVDWEPESTVSPGGSDSYVQYNDGGSFGGESTFTYNDATNKLTIEDLEVTTGLFDGSNSDGDNYELLTSTGTESRWKTISNSITGRYLYIDLDGTTIGAGVDLSSANLSDAGKIYNNSTAQNLYQVSPTKMTGWGTTESFSGSGIVWSSANDRYTVTGAGKYRVQAGLNIDGTTEATATPVRFEIRVNGSKVGIYQHVYADPDRYVTFYIDETFDLSSNDYIEIFTQRGDAGTGKTVTLSATSESFFSVQRINY